MNEVTSYKMCWTGKLWDVVATGTKCFRSLAIKKTPPYKLRDYRCRLSSGRWNLKFNSNDLDQDRSGPSFYCLVSLPTDSRNLKMVALVARRPCKARLNVSTNLNMSSQRTDGMRISTNLNQRMDGLRISRNLKMSVRKNRQVVGLHESEDVLPKYRRRAADAQMSSSSIATPESTSGAFT